MWFVPYWRKEKKGQKWREDEEKSKQLLSDPKEARGYWNLKEEACGELSVEEALYLL